MTMTARPDHRAAMLRVVAWLIERHHASLGLWPWTWTGTDGEPYVTLYARCVSLRFGDDFGALASWLEAQRWPAPDETPHPATLLRDRLLPAAWAVTPPQPGGPQPPHMPGADIEQLARSGASIETLAQLLAAASGLDRYLAMLAPQRHAGHPHRGPEGQMAVLMLRLVTELALMLGDDYQVPWSGPAGGLPNGISDPNWAGFQHRFRLTSLPFPPAAQDLFLLGQRGWLHAVGRIGNRHGTVIQASAEDTSDAAYSALRAAALGLLAPEMVA
jgi:hypothetical protein